tara:strand:+ start:109 stop:435 length:327 start_codon:yes stop_codon:yes gene_type:complete
MIIINYGSQQLSGIGNKLRDLINNTLNTHKTIKELMIIVPPPFVISKKKIFEVVNAEKNLHSNIRIGLYPFSTFVLEVPKVKLMPKYEIIDRTSRDVHLAEEKKISFY